MKLTDKVEPFSAYNDLKQQTEAFQRYITALNLPATPEHFAWWMENRAPDKKSWEWTADAPPSTEERKQPGRFDHDWNDE